MKLIIAADNHLGWNSISKFSRMTGDSAAAWSAVVFHAAELDCPILQVGDILDVGTTGGVSYGLSQLKDLKAQVYFVVGNHDDPGTTAGHENPAWLDCLSGFHHLGNKPLSLGELKLAGVDYIRSAEESATAVKKLKNSKLDVLAVHGSLDSLSPSMSCLYKVSDLVGVARLVVVGDTHIPWEQKTEDGTIILSPGATERQRISDLLPDNQGLDVSPLGYWVADVTKTTCELTYHKIPDAVRRPAFLFRPKTVEDAQRNIATVKEAMRSPAQDSRLPELRMPLVYVRAADGLGVDALFRAELPDVFLDIEVLGAGDVESVMDIAESAAAHAEEEMVLSYEVGGGFRDRRRAGIHDSSNFVICRDTNARGGRGAR